MLGGLDLTVPGGCAASPWWAGRRRGKSTLASLAGRLIDPDEGEITLDGVALRRAAPGQALRDAVVYAFERPALFGETPFEAISFGAFAAVAVNRCWPRREAAAPPRSSRRLPGGIADPAG